MVWKMFKLTFNAIFKKNPSRLLINKKKRLKSEGEFTKYALGKQVNIPVSYQLQVETF